MKRLFLTSSFSSVAKLFEDFAGEPVKGKNWLLSQQQVW